MYATKFSTYGSRVCLIKVHEYKKQNPSGAISNSGFESDVRFDNLTQLLFAMESIYDEFSNPQKAVRPRGFARGQPDSPARTETDPEAKILATFKVEVMFRQNASWQGNLVWLETKQEAQFRSVLEMIMIMDSAFTAMTEQQTN